jgi:FkbM family methyltransferase
VRILSEKDRATLFKIRRLFDSPIPGEAAAARGRAAAILAKHDLKLADLEAVEANPSLIGLLKETLMATAGHGNTWRIVNRLVSDRDETLPFYVDPNTTMSSVMPRPGNVIHVQSMRLDDLHDPEQKTFIKMDIEGAEYRALAGAPKLLASRNVTFLIEVHPWGDPVRRKYPLHVAGLMLARGYGMRKVVPRYFLGSHFVFAPAPLPRRLAAYLYHLPVLLATFMLYRWFPGHCEQVTDVARRWMARRKLALQ